MPRKNEQPDPRIKRTHQAIKQALIDLMEEKGFDAITVRDLTARAQINRATFYLHYTDKYDLLQKTADEMIDGFIKGIQLPQGFEAEDLNMDADTPPQSFIRHFEHMAEHAPFYRVMLGAHGLPGFAGRLEQAIRDAFYHRTSLAQPQDRELLVPRDILVRYSTSAHLGVIMQWLEQDMPYTPRYMAALLKRLHILGPTNAAVVQLHN